MLACVTRPVVVNPTGADLDHVYLPVSHRLRVKGEITSAPREATARDVAKVEIQTDFEVLAMNLQRKQSIHVHTLPVHESLQPYVKYT